MSTMTTDHAVSRPDDRAIDRVDRLDEIGVGRPARLVGVDHEMGTSELLHAMGLRPGCTLTLCRGGHACVVRVDGGAGGCCRVGMTRAMVRGLRVEPCASACVSPADARA